jgi:hypothetical protein
MKVSFGEKKTRTVRKAKGEQRARPEREQVQVKVG